MSPHGGLFHAKIHFSNMPKSYRSGKPAGEVWEKNGVQFLKTISLSSSVIFRHQVEIRGHGGTGSTGERWQGATLPRSAFPVRRRFAQFICKLFLAYDLFRVGLGNEARCTSALDFIHLLPLRPTNQEELRSKSRYCSLDLQVHIPASAIPLNEPQ